MATSPTCATNFSFRLFAWVQPLHGHRLVATYWRSRWNARCMAIGGLEVSATAASPSASSAGRERKAASPSISISSKPRRGVDHLLQQPRGVDLGVREAHPVRAHVVGVAADVGDEQERPPGRHARPYQSRGLSSAPGRR